jgi:hypothetical protein
MLPYIVTDIETGSCSNEQIQAALSAWKPPANVRDPEKIEVRRKEAEIRLRDKSALLDGSPILCTGVCSDTQAVVFDGRIS